MRTRFALASSSFVLAAAIAAPAPAQTTSRASVDSAGLEGNASHDFSSLSADGRVVAFESRATNLVIGDSNGVEDVFVHDRITGETFRASVDSAGNEGNAASEKPSVSADGRFIAFHSDATNLVPGDTNGAFDVFIHDRVTHETSRVSVDSLGAQANGNCRFPAITPDARFVAFQSGAANLVSGDTNGSTDVFVHDRQTGATVRVSLDSAAAEGDASSERPAISADGRTVAFTSQATNLVPGDTNGFQDTFVHDRQTGATTRVSVDSLGLQGDSASFDPAISSDGRIVAFGSFAGNLVPGGAAPHDTFVHDLVTGETSRVSVDSSGEARPGDLCECSRPSISADGRYVAFRSSADGLVPGDSNGFTDVFVHDRGTGVTVQVSVSSNGAPGIGGSERISISADGMDAAFDSEDTTLVPGDSNGVQDVFLRDLRDPAACRAGTVNSGAGPSVNVLAVNGGIGVVSLGLRESLRIDLAAAPLGPDPARYIAWVWLGFPSQPLDLAVGASTLGCTVNPTPLRPLAAPQAFRCLRGSGIPATACRGISELTAPPRAPWSLSKNGGFGNAIVLTFQAVLEDAGAGNPKGFSVTNAVTLRVE